MLDVFFGAVIGACVGAIVLSGIAIYDLVWRDFPMGPGYYYAVPIFLGIVAVGALIGLAL